MGKGSVDVRFQEEGKGDEASRMVGSRSETVTVPSIAVDQTGAL